LIPFSPSPFPAPVALGPIRFPTARSAAKSPALESILKSFDGRVSGELFPGVEFAFDFSKKGLAIEGCGAVEGLLEDFIANFAA
jgi:hypothetical protein